MSEFPKSFDAAEWAEAFCAATGLGDIETTTEWFAKALSRGYFERERDGWNSTAKPTKRPSTFEESDRPR